MKLVLIEWIDSHSLDSWAGIEELKGACSPLHCRSVGWLIAKKSGYTLLTTGLCGEKDNIIVKGRDHFAIPDCCIQKVTVLRKNG